MSLNPFEEKPVDIESTIQDWSQLYPNNTIRMK